jgi:urease accessory protein
LFFVSVASFVSIAISRFWRVMDHWQLIDSAFPSGGFAHSLGLEAAYQAGEVANERSLRRFLEGALLQAGYTLMPLMTATYREPRRLGELDAIADAFLTNAVANRASRVQGRAFVAACARIWPSDAMQAIEAEARRLCAHQAPLMGAALRVLELPLQTAQRMVLFQTSRGVLAAAVRLGIVGPFRAQRLQHDAGADIDLVLSRCASLDESSLAQPAPILDLLQSAHDRLYSRLFQS